MASAAGRRAIRSEGQRANAPVRREVKRQQGRDVKSNEAADHQTALVNAPNGEDEEIEESITLTITIEPNHHTKKVSKIAPRAASEHVEETSAKAQRIEKPVASPTAHLEVSDILPQETLTVERPSEDDERSHQGTVEPPNNLSTSPEVVEDHEIGYETGNIVHEEDGARTAPLATLVDGWPTQDPSAAAATATASNSHEPKRGRGRGRPRGRGLGAGRAAMNRENPLHIRAKPTPRGSRPRGNIKGVKRGPRKPLEPSDEFKALKSQAMTAYMNSDFQGAQDLVEEAILINPEIFSAYALLSSIHMALGNEAKAATALFHGAHIRPKHAETWKMVAESLLDIVKDRSVAFGDAIYCYNRAIAADRDDIESRMKRAELLFETGRFGKAIADYKHALRLSPRDLEIVYQLSRCYSHEGHPQVAIPYYDDALEHYCANHTEQVSAFFWSHPNIYAELHLLSKRYSEGLIKLKRLSRWFLGRASDTYWDDFTDDDREFDAEDFPRRLQVPHFNPEKYQFNTYGFGMPIELRLKLALFRLKLGPPPHEEAMRHFDWLDPTTSSVDNLIPEYSDVLREAGDALKEAEYYDRALNFYEALQYDHEYEFNKRYYIDTGQCYENKSMYNEAEGCFRTAAGLDELDEEALEHLLKMFKHLGASQEMKSVRKDITSRKHKKAVAQRTEQKQYQLTAPVDPDVPIVSVEDQMEDDEAFDARMLMQPMSNAREHSTSAVNRTKDPHGRAKIRDVLSRDLRPSFETLAAFDAGFTLGDESSKSNWLEVSRSAIDHFQAYKYFWPYESTEKFSGYKNWYEKSTFKPQDRQNLTSQSPEPEAEGQAPVPDHYCQVKFTEWLKLFMRYALRVCETTKVSENNNLAYNVCKMAASCSVWRSNREASATIHLVWGMCAAKLNDHEMLCAICRHFSKKYQFVSDAYRLYAALNRYCSLENEQFAAGPSQKYLLRQLKAMDICLSEMTGGKFGVVLAEKAGLSNFDENGNPLTAKEVDVALLALYGHMLYATGSFAYGIHYFYRAHAIESNNPMILLSLAVGYMHHLVKRQADNRHMLITIGLSFLFRYYQVRHESGNALEKQEAEFNVARTLHFLGLTGLALPYYERSLALHHEVEKLMLPEQRAQNFARDTAFSLRGIYSQSGQLEEAQKVTERWLRL